MASQSDPGLSLPYSLKELNDAYPFTFSDEPVEFPSLFPDEDSDDSVSEPVYPSMVDGLNPNQRKILLCCFKMNIVNATMIADIACHVRHHFAYRNSWKSIHRTVVGMAQVFVGSNNINLLVPHGGVFGCRYLGNIDETIWSMSTYLSPITRYLFPEVDDCVLDYLEEDGQSIEPAWYAPIIPMVLVNGCGTDPQSITYIPKYNPREIVKNLIRLLNGEQMESMSPWYRGFKGKFDKTGSDVYTISGTIDDDDGDDEKTSFSVTELPIGPSCQKVMLVFFHRSF